MKKVKEEWCPTQAGSYTAYYPEWLDGKKWKPIKLDIVRDGKGFPYPEFLGGVSRAIGLCGYEQAQALAWGYAAFAASEPFMKTPKVRVQEYDVVYSIKAKKAK